MTKHEKKNFENTHPLVSVCCTTYNHENYICDAIESFLMQETNFPIEIIIHDDHSTDGTVKLVKKYTDAYPEKIFPILQKENQFSKGVKPLMNIALPKARGKYIAVCEGDDYWTDPLKLQKQVEFMEANPDCSLCFHASKKVRADNPKISFIHRPSYIPENHKFEMKDAILGSGGFMSTCSMLFLNSKIQTRPEWTNTAPAGDIAMMLLLASEGKIGYLDETMSSYRILSKNSWTSSMKNRKKRQLHHARVLKMWNEFDVWTNRRYQTHVNRSKLKYNFNYHKTNLRLIIRPIYMQLKKVFKSLLF